MCLFAQRIFFVLPILKMKLFNLLNKLNKRDLTKFHNFVSTPVFNQRSDVKLLLQTWIKNKGRKYPAPEYWALLFPEQPYSMKKWNLLTSRLFKLLEEYLAFVEIRKNESLKKYYLAKAYRNIQQEKLFKEAIRDAGRALEKQAYRNAEYLQVQHELSFEKYDYVISINRKEKTNLQEVSDHLDAYILAAKLRQACYALSREVIKQEKYQIGFLKETLDYIEATPSYLNIPTIAVYYYCYQAISVVDSEHFFQKLRETITTYQRYFPPSEMRDIYTLTINYAIRRLNTGTELFAREALELYRLSLEQGYLLEDGILLESAYSNIVSLASKLNQHEWAEGFVHEYKNHLKPAFKAPLFHFNLGRLYYEQGQLENSLQELIKVETKASFLLLGARILQLKIYYELEEFDPLDSLLESLRVYLQRSKNLGYRKEHYANVIAFTRQLLQLPVMSKKEQQAFQQRINDAEIFAEKEWFLKQLG